MEKFEEFKKDFKVDKYEMQMKQVFNTCCDLCMMIFVDIGDGRRNGIAA